MTSRDFCFWLQGYFEMSASPQGLSVQQAEMVKAHLALVFKHEIDPSMGPPEHQKVLNEVHHKPEVTPSGGHLPGRPDLVMRC